MNNEHMFSLFTSHHTKIQLKRREKEDDYILSIMSVNRRY